MDESGEGNALDRERVSPLPRSQVEILRPHSWQCKIRNICQIYHLSWNFDFGREDSNNHQKEMSKYLSIHRKIHVVTSSASVGNWCGQIYFGQMTPTVDLSLTWSYTPARRTDRNYIRRGGNLFLSLRKHFKWHWGTSLLKMQLKNAAARITSQCKILLVWHFKERLTRSIFSTKDETRSAVGGGKGVAASLALPVCIPFGEVDTMDTGDTVDTVYKTAMCHLCQNPHVMPIYAPYVPSRLCNMESKSPTMHRLGNSVWCTGWPCTVLTRPAGKRGGCWKWDDNYETRADDKKIEVEDDGGDDCDDNQMLCLCDAADFRARGQTLDWGQNELWAFTVTLTGLGEGRWVQRLWIISRS